ncbi:MAG TPA: biotin/lipoyl-binding protein, partial [Solirubrobacteraceae bacterium]|nr:biotin/lipoyl-binding protein [Solirubrobacteraceae bacterium]
MAVIVIVAGVAYYWHEKAKAKEAVHYETVKVEKGKIVAKVTATGTLSAIVTVQVGSQVSGRILAWYADFNAPVTKGQLVAKIDPALFQAAVDQAKANLMAAQGNLAKDTATATDAERQYERNVTLLARKLIA